MINFNDQDQLQKFGFVGFKSVDDLNKNPNLIPAQMGVYLVLTKSNQNPKYLAKGVGGFFKGKDPNISMAELQANWVENARTVYIGKAGGITGSATLRSRLKQYLKFGQGKNIGHYGGRLVWQLEHHLDLIFCWLPMTEAEPRNLEKILLADFIKQYGQRPFANLTG